MNLQQELIPRSTGDYLKQQRKGKRLSIAIVSQATGLDERLLGEIEADRASNIAPVYRNGYIRVYARFLKIPEDEIQALLESGEAGEPPIRSIFPKPPNRNPADRWLRVTSYVLGSLLIGTLAWQFTHEAVRLSQNGSRLQDAQDQASETVQVENLERAQGIKGTVNASIAPLGTLHDEGREAPDMAENAWAAINRPALPEGESQLQISVSADSWVEILDAAGQQLEMDLLRGGNSKDYHGRPPFRILLGRASAVRLSVDGEPVDLSMYSRDDVARLIWPEALPELEKGQDIKQ